MTRANSTKWTPGTSPGKLMKEGSLSMLDRSAGEREFHGQSGAGAKAPQQKSNKDNGVQTGKRNYHKPS